MIFLVFWAFTGVRKSQLQSQRNCLTESWCAQRRRASEFFLPAQKLRRERERERHPHAASRKLPQDNFLSSQLCPRSLHHLRGIFRCSASLAIPHRKSFAAIACVSLVLLGRTNCSVSLSHESQREIALVEALSRPIPDYQQREVGEITVSQGCVFDMSQAVRVARFESVSEPPAESHDTMPLNSPWGDRERKRLSRAISCEG